MVKMLKILFLQNKKLLSLYEEGKFSRHFFKSRFITYFFQRILRINSQAHFPVHFTSQVLHPEKISLGKKVWISFMLSGGCYIQANNGISIGDNTIFAPGVKIISANHSSEDINKHEQESSIYIGENCWIGANAIILPGVSIGDNCIVGAGSVVVKSIEGNCTVVGNPAREL